MNKISLYAQNFQFDFCVERGDSVKTGSNRTRKPMPVKNFPSDTKRSEQIERNSRSVSRKQDSLKRAPLRENRYQVPRPVSRIQVESESESNQSDCEDSNHRKDNSVAGKLACGGRDLNDYADLLLQGMKVTQKAAYLR